ncbi:MAG: hypothetical protein AAGF12_37080 [Myxococcota bacterium]
MSNAATSALRSSLAARGASWGLVLIGVLAGCSDASGSPVPPTGKDFIPPDLPEVEIPVDESNRFVHEDFQRFMEAFPDVMQSGDEERFRMCTGDACLASTPESVGAFDGEGVRYLVPLWFRACLSQSGQGCELIAQAFNGSTVARFPVFEGLPRAEADAKTHRYATRACELSERHCRMWSSQVLRGVGAPDDADVGRAIERMRTGCAAQDHHACAILAKAAERHVQIGSRRQWFEKACEHGAGPPENRYCDDFVLLLFDSGTRADRRRAVEIAAPICDLESPAWEGECEGTVAEGTLQCPRFHLRFADSCTRYAETLPPDEALSLYMALCRTLSIDMQEEQNIERCRRALRLAERTRQPDEMVRTLRTRICDEVKMACDIEHEFDASVCGPVRATCMAEGPQVVQDAP